MPTDPRSDTLTGLVVVRGGGSAVLWRRLPRRSAVGVGQGERHGLVLPAPWVPRDLATLVPVDSGWLVVNGRRAPMQLESEWVQGGRVVYLAGGTAALQPGETRLTWPALDGPVSLSVSVRTRRLDDQRVPYAVDGRLPGSSDSASIRAGAAVRGGDLRAAEPPLALQLRYWLAVLFRHLLEGDSEPLDLVRKRAAYLGVAEETLAEAAHRHRRRVNAERGLQLGDLYELGLHLVKESGDLVPADLEP